MKIYKKRKLNAMYLLHNLQRVGDLKEGMEIMVSTEDEVYFTSSYRKNKFSEDYTIDNLVPLIKNFGPFDVDPVTKRSLNSDEIIEMALSLDNIIGNNVLQFKDIAGVKCLVMTLSEYMVKNLKEIYQEDDYIVFDNLSLTNLGARDDVEDLNVDMIIKTIAILPQITKMHTDEDFEVFYQLVAKKILEKEDIVKRLLNDEEVPGTNGRIWTKKGFENELQILSDLAPLVNASENKVLAIKIFFGAMKETPLLLFKLLGINLDNIQNAMVTKTFS